MAGISVRVHEPAGGSSVDVLLLHGLPASSDVFGADFDLPGVRTIAPDLPGFGRSLDRRDVDRAAFAVAPRLVQLEALLAELRAGDPRGDRPLVIAGHSMGALLALHLGAGMAKPPAAVIAWSAPLHRSPDAARAALRATGFVGRWLALDTPIAKLVCTNVCAHPGSWRLAIIAGPHLPTSVSRWGTQHSFDSYVGTLDGVMLDPAWRAALGRLEQRGVAVALATAVGDPMVDASLYAQLGRAHPKLHVEMFDGDQHVLPISQSARCVQQLGSAVEAARRATSLPAPSTRR